ncbi:TrkA C-terminal domain-containing protein [Mahella sp.]|uniref:TrkA C-terminal domain-containing protein n=1 Tax=Mahella sp. TaxID=2798721 RepID=UPI0025C3228F|nr:TrkA C-terminal domain-containing protein [Mahella sp.]MBZ4666804.1 TrkA-C domain protein [Mahella sp.]
MDENVIGPRYQNIALDIAKRIAEGEFYEGQRLYGRSNLAGRYKVSPETIRRAVSLLQDVGVVATYQGKGIIVISKDAAAKYIKRFEESKVLESLLAELGDIMEEREQLDKRLKEIVSVACSWASGANDMAPYNITEIEVREDSHVTGKTISEVKFWQNTGATIIAIKRGNTIIVSPGPYNDIQAKDVLVIAGDENVRLRTEGYLYER